MSEWSLQGESLISFRKLSRGVSPSRRMGPTVMPSRFMGSTPLCSIMAITARGSSPSGGVRRCALCLLAIQAAATCSAVAPSGCDHCTSALRFRSSRQTFALPAANPVFSAGVFVRGSLASASARASSRSRKMSREPFQHAAWIAGTLHMRGSLALASALASRIALRDFGHGLICRLGSPMQATTNSEGISSSPMPVMNSLVSLMASRPPVRASSNARAAACAIVCERH
mmetsp:Transcript_22669/g.64356  ORF Transcript_22669/g.64356 Transcript_22669/m.64356 type:complete len:229 (+) Transcript_22669:898-1584(+)